jgi:hypothetical protein
MLSSTSLSILLLVGLGFVHGPSSPPGSIRGDVITKETSGEPVALLVTLIVLRGLLTRETGWDAMGAFAVDSPFLAANQIEATAPCLYTALATEVSAGHIFHRSSRNECQLRSRHYLN